MRRHTPLAAVTRRTFRSSAVDLPIISQTLGQFRRVSLRHIRRQGLRRVFALVERRPTDDRRRAGAACVRRNVHVHHFVPGQAIRLCQLQLPACAPPRRPENTPCQNSSCRCRCRQTVGTPPGKRRVPQTSSRRQTVSPRSAAECPPSSSSCPTRFSARPPPVKPSRRSSDSSDPQHTRSRRAPRSRPPAQSGGRNRCCPAGCIRTRPCRPLPRLRPYRPCGPYSPSALALPVGPCSPFGPCAPCGPCSPFGPCAPCACTPVSSSADKPVAVLADVRRRAGRPRQFRFLFRGQVVKGQAERLLRAFDVNAHWRALYAARAASLVFLHFIPP